LRKEGLVATESARAFMRLALSFMSLAQDGIRPQRRNAPWGLALSSCLTAKTGCVGAMLKRAVRSGNSQSGNVSLSRCLLALSLKRPHIVYSRQPLPCHFLRDVAAENAILAILPGLGAIAEKGEIVRGRHAGMHEVTLGVRVVELLLNDFARRVTCPG